jgi:hypothetical protein
LSAIDAVLKRWQKDLINLEKAIKAEKDLANKARLTADQAASLAAKHEAEAVRGDTIVTNFKRVLAMPTNTVDVPVES